MSAGLALNRFSGDVELTGPGSAPGTTQLEVFAPPGSGRTPAIAAAPSLAADTDYTVVAIGDGPNQSLLLLLLVDDLSAPSAGNAKIRVVHAAPFAAALADTAVSVRQDDGTLVNGCPRSRLAWNQVFSSFQPEAMTWLSQRRTAVPI